MVNANFAKKRLRVFGADTFFLVLLLICVGLVSAETTNKGLKISVYLDDKVYVGAEYTSLFKVENLDHVAGITDRINLTLGYNITFNNTLIKNEITQLKDLNSYKSSSTGVFLPTLAGNYTLTCWIINSTILDANKEDDISSKTIQVIDTSYEKCNITLNITSDRFIYNESESIKFYNNINDEKYPFIIEYWIEDLFGNICKNKYNTTNTNEKSWKTDIDEQDRILLIKSVVYPLCKDSDLSDNSAERMFLVKSNDISSQQAAGQNSKDSSLEITDADSTASFGDAIKVKVSAYRGDTGKYSISLYAQSGSTKISEITKFNIEKKYSSYKGQIPLQLKPNCDLKLENKKYDIILEGLGEEDKKSIRLEGVNKDLCKENKLSTNIGDNKGGEKFEYSLLEFPEEIQPGQEFKTKVQLVNNDDSDYDIGIWSYVYRGSKCYSGERTENKQELNLKKGTSQVVGLSNIIKDAETGDYNLKVFINKNNQKTNKEITESIKVLGSTEDSSSVFNKPSKITNLAEYNLINQLLCTDSMHYKQQIYESSNERIKKMIPYFMIFLTTLLSIVLIWKR